MKGRLITNGILSIVYVILSILNALILLNTNITVETIFLVNLYMISFIISFVMGIVTLSMKKHPSARGLTIASGVLAIFGGVCGVNIIISFLAVRKINQSEQNILINEQN